jgi:murein DD-endopeptidase MepM/ murein hydrolase activator NlpD
MDSYAEELKRSIMRNLSPLAASKFEEIEPNTRMPFWNEASRFEAGQMGDYNNMVFESSLTENMNSVAENPYNPEMFDMAAAEGGLLIQSHMRGAPESAVKQAQKSYVSGLESRRIAAVAETDPILANELIQESALLSPEDRAKMERAVKPEAEQAQARSISERAMEQFGGEYDAAKGVAWIRENVSDPDLADKAVSVYTGRMREKNMSYALEGAQIQETQRQNADRLRMDYANGGAWTDDDINQGVENKDISASVGAGALNANAAMADYGASTRKLEKTPGWNQLSEYQKDMLYMQEANTTPETHAAAMQTLNEGLGGETDEARVKDFVNRRLITREEGRNLIASIKGFDKKNKANIDGIKNFFGQAMDPTKKTSAVKDLYPVSDYMMRAGELNAYIAELSAMRDPDIVKKVGEKAIQLQNEIIQEVYNLTDKTGDDTERVPSWRRPEFMEDRRPSEYAQGITRAKSALEDMIISALNSKPTPVKTAEMTRVDMPKIEGSSASAISMDILGGKYELTSGFDAKRKRGLHGGYDFAAPIGTPVRTPSVIGGGFSVAAVVADQSGSHSGNGNRVVLRGQDAMGNNVEWQFNHLSEVNPDLKPGSQVNPGVILGKVGNTGTVIASPGGNGAHLDLKIKVNGKLTEPSKYYAMTGQSARSSAAPPASPNTAAEPAPPASTGPAEMTDEQIRALPESERIKYLRNRRERNAR